MKYVAEQLLVTAVMSAVVDHMIDSGGKSSKAPRAGTHVVHVLY
jgi:hypothetical protein